MTDQEADALLNLLELGLAKPGTAAEALRAYVVELRLRAQCQPLAADAPAPQFLPINDDIARTMGKPRSGRWPAVRAAHLREHPTCAVCGAAVRLEVHHCRPYHLHPELELDPANLITLCETEGGGHHQLFGHLGAWASWNETVREDAAAWLAKIAGRPKVEVPAQ